MRSLARTLLVAIPFAASFVGCVTDSSEDLDEAALVEQALTTALDAEETAFLNQLNSYRSSQGLGRLDVSSALTQAADYHSQEMANHLTVQHESFPPCSPCDAFSRIKRWYNYATYLGENVAAGYATGAGVLQGWKGSAAHNANMLSGHFVVIGIARVRASNGVWYWTTDFGGYRDQGTLFSDVPSTHWAYSWIERLYNAGITGGCATNPLMYCPASAVSRAQMAVFLERGLRGSSYTPPAARGTVFTDVPASHWAAAWIERLAADGITGGCGNGEYCPETTVTRDQMAVFLLRAKHGSSYAPPAATGVFGDVPGSHWAAAWIERLAAEAITGGCGGGNYCPGNPVTRDQMAVFLVKTFNLP